MAAAQKRVSVASSSHSLSDYVCQGQSAPRMNKTLAPFKTLIEVSAVQRKLQNSVLHAVVMAAINTVVE